MLHALYKSKVVVAEQDIYFPEWNCKLLIGL